MTSRERDELRAEVGTLEGFLAALPAGRILERRGFERRLANARSRLAELEAAPVGRALPVAFWGRPVEGDRSIEAGFAGDALRALIDASRSIAAEVVLGASLEAAGPIPDVGRELRLVQTYPGSFGFELELPPAESAAQRELAAPVAAEDRHAEAVEVLLRLLNAAAATDDEALSDLVTEVGPRSRAKARAFAELLARGDARFRADFGDVRVRLDDAERVKRVVDGLAEQDVEETEVSWEATVVGVLPHGRQFEAELADGSLVKGKVDRGLGPLTDFKAAWEGRPALLVMRRVQLRQNVRHVLVRAKALADADGADDAAPA
jgi:hypothetical protein